MYKMKLVIGDWSNDGHGKTEEVFLECNHTVEEIQEAYKNSCKLTGLSFSDTDYTGLKLDWAHPEYKDRKIAVDYESSSVSLLAEKILKEHGIVLREEEDIDDDLYYIDDFTTLWMKFVKLSLPDLEYQVIKDTTPVINGYWNENLNVQFGYGLFD